MATALKKLTNSNAESQAPKTRKPKDTGDVSLSVISHGAKAEQSLLAAALQFCDRAVFVCGTDWTIISANQKANDLLTGMPEWEGNPLDAVVGTNFSAFFSDSASLATATHPRNFPLDTTISVGPYICHLNATELVSSTGSIMGYTVSWDNVTEELREKKRSEMLVGALDQAHAGFMIANENLEILHANHTLLRNLKAWEPEFQQVFGPTFRADQIIGRSIDDFHKNPAHQRSLLSSEANLPYESKITVGSVIIDLRVNSLKDPSGKIIGYASVWLDVTQQTNEDAAYRRQVQAISERIEMLRSVCVSGIAEGINSLAQGDLTVKVEPKTPELEIPPQTDLATMAKTFNTLRSQIVDTIGSYNMARDYLAKLLSQTQISASSISNAAQEVMTGNDDLAQRTEEQAASLEESAASMDQMTSTVKQNADNAKQADQLAVQARETAEKGSAVVNQAVVTMDEINKASKRIADIISVIDEIAFQTNLLALNAAVEAARVGEQGRGFAVVAAEVRNLAGRSATAAKEIKALVQDSVHKVEEGTNFVNQSGTQLEEIMTAVKKVADIISEIAAAATEQSAGIEQVNTAIGQMDQITQQNAALVEEASAASQSMYRQAADLQTLVAQFTVDDELTKKYQEEFAAQEATVPRANRPQEQKTLRRPNVAQRNLDDFEEF